MTKTKLIACVAASMIGLTGGAFADGPGRVTVITADNRPCVFFRTNGGDAYYAILSVDTNIKFENEILITSKVIPNQYVWFQTLPNDSIWCGDNWFEHASNLSLY